MLLLIERVFLVLLISVCSAAFQNADRQESPVDSGSRILDPALNSPARDSSHFTDFSAKSEKHPALPSKQPFNNIWEPSSTHNSLPGSDSKETVSPNYLLLPPYGGYNASDVEDSLFELVQDKFTKSESGVFGVLWWLTTLTPDQAKILGKRHPEVSLLY